ncbi:BrnA antitoxin family protein [Thiothrix nivea]|uniref:CopG/DNA-binding domain-containing protein n=1 Tax=Thiothrix nivea (strain ATCC 35100 / DSM 5205 / JP2) TaxID=870187 RepID=A0A656HD95_THINJ|nr:BrnA antitoxin family protein [Thiothrix nivea]EIJ33430.1 CopG/DNA-binding domain-containing protein [Thiothrix nivea DSM 5205]
MNNQHDFSGGKRGAVIKTNKEKITIRFDPDVVQWFRDQVKGGGNYQSLINDALKAHIKQEGQSLETVLRRVIREEMMAERKQVAA